MKPTDLAAGVRLSGLVDRGFDEVRLFTNARMTENLAYYPRQGYVETHRDEVNGFHRVFFAKHL